MTDFLVLSMTLIDRLELWKSWKVSQVSVFSMSFYNSMTSFKTSVNEKKWGCNFVQKNWT